MRLRETPDLDAYAAACVPILPRKMSPAHKELQTKTKGHRHGDKADNDKRKRSKVIRKKLP